MDAVKEELAEARNVLMVAECNALLAMEAIEHGDVTEATDCLGETVKRIRAFVRKYK